jgi:glutamate racemase
LAKVQLDFAFLNVMIGVFDSGLGGMQTMQYLREILPTYDFCYLGDTHYVPYGDRSGEWIRERTFQCLEWLFAQ